MKKRNIVAAIMLSTLATSTLMTGCGKETTEKESTETSETTEASETGESTESIVDTSVLFEQSDYEKLKFDDYVTIGDYSALMTIKEADYSVSDEEIQKEIDYYTDLYGTAEQIKEGAVENGQTINIDFVGTIDGEKISGSSSEDYSLTIGSDTFIDGFEDGLIGATVGEAKTLNLKFPDNYTDSEGKESEYAGKDVVFEVTVNYIEGTKTPAEFTDDFVKEITSEDYTTVADFTTYIKNHLASQKKQTILTTLKENLVEICEFKGDLSEFTDKEYENGVKYYTDYAESSGYTMEEFAEACGYDNEQALLDYIKEDSETYVKEKIALYALGEKLGIKLTDDDYTKGSETIVSLYGYGSLEELLSQYSSSIVRFDIFSDFMADKAIETWSEK